MFIFSELAGVREHDLEVTDQARAAEENVSLTNNNYYYCVDSLINERSLGVL